MARAPLSQEELDAFRQRAVRVGTRLFAERGVEGVSVRAIAKELGVSAMTPYRYFTDKDALFAAVRADAFRRFADRQEAAYGAGGPTAALIRRLGSAYVGFALDEPAAYRIMFQLDQQPGGAYPEVDREATRAISFLIQAVSDGVADGYYEGDALTVAHLKWATVHGIVSLHLAGKLTMGPTLDALVVAALLEDDG